MASGTGYKQREDMNKACFILSGEEAPSDFYLEFRCHMWLRLRTALFARQANRNLRHNHGTALVLLFVFVPLDIIPPSSVETGLELIL